MAKKFDASFQPHLLASAVGSLPHADPVQALTTIWRSVPKAPHWPQLPQSGPESSFVGQYLRALVDTGVIEGYAEPRFQVARPDWPQRLAAFYELYLEAEAGGEKALAQFGFSPAGGEGFEAFCRDLAANGTRGAVLLKGQLSGPLTIGLQITDANRRSSYYDEPQHDLLVKSVQMHARWQTRSLRSFGLPVLMMVDDPSLYGYGASTHVTLSRGQLVADLNEITAAIAGEGGIPGVHVCAGMDWTLLFEAEVQVVNFDAYNFMTSMLVLADEIDEFLKRGGVLSWGIVPTNQNAWGETPQSLKQRLAANMQELIRRGVDATRLRRQSMLTPSCGTGTLSVELAEHVYALLGELERELAAHPA